MLQSPHGNCELAPLTKDHLSLSESQRPARSKEEEEVRGVVWLSWADEVAVPGSDMFLRSHSSELLLRPLFPAPSWLPISLELLAALLRAISLSLQPRSTI